MGWVPWVNTDHLVLTLHRYDVPRSTGITSDGAASELREAVHGPDGGLAGIVLPFDIAGSRSHGFVKRKNYRRPYGIWLDESGTPVKFDMVNAQGTVTFSLAL